MKVKSISHFDCQKQPKSFSFNWRRHRRRSSRYVDACRVMTLQLNKNTKTSLLGAQKREVETKLHQKKECVQLPAVHCSLVEDDAVVDPGLVPAASVDLVAAYIVYNPATKQKT